MKFQLIIDKTAEEQIIATVHGRSALTDKIEALVLQQNGADDIAAYREDDIKRLAFADIACITIEDGKTYAIDRTGQRWRLRQRLYELEALLPSSFLRLSKSALGNEAQLERFSASFSGAVDAIFKCGHREYVSRRCFAQIKRRFD